MKPSTDLRCYGISFSVFCLVIIGNTAKNCPRPDVPIDGKCTPQWDEYLPGVKVIYMCKDGYILAGDDIRKCNSNGTWSGKTPFCDREMKIKNLHGYLSLSHSSISTIIDGHMKTCPSWRICAGCRLELKMDEKTIIDDIKIVLKESGTAPVRIEASLSPSGEICNHYYGQIKEEHQWITIHCPFSKYLDDTINIVNAANTDMFICEIRVHRKYGTYRGDREVDLKNLRGIISLLPPPTSDIIDGNNFTCLSWSMCAGCNLQLHLDEQAAVPTNRIFLKAKGTENIRMETYLNSNREMCGVYEGHITTSQWIGVQCQSNNTPTNVINIKNTADTDTTICEIQVFGTNENDCELPPEMRIANGYFEVSRNKSTLICEDGYKSENGRLDCSENSWKSLGPKCDEAKLGVSVVTGAVGAVVAIIMLILVGIIIFLARKQRKKETIVAYNSVSGIIALGSESENTIQKSDSQTSLIIDDQPRCILS